MHKNERFNIYSIRTDFISGWVVIDGQRTDSGNLEYGAKIISGVMTRDEAIALADKLQSEVV